MPRNQTHNYRAMNDVALTSSVNSNWMDIRNMSIVGIQIAVTSCTGNNGQFSIEISNQSVDSSKLNLDQNTITIFDTLTVTPSIPALANAATTITVNVANVGFNWIRIKFTAGVTHTDGIANAYIVAKE